MKTIALMFIKLYRKVISPILPSSCIYSPTCSEYASIAIKRFGFMKGSWLSLIRIIKCNPFKEGGYDPVPFDWEKRK